MTNVFIGIDNGVTGTIGVITDKKTYCLKVLTKTEQSYTKAKQNITRIDIYLMKEVFKNIIYKQSTDVKINCLLERPMVNPMRFKATMSAIRALEATLNVLELLNIPYEYIDSKEWQKELLPKGCKKEELKKASQDIGIRMFPEFKEKIKEHKDADGLLIAEHCRRKYK